MVRPERRVVLAGASPARVSGSRLQPSGVIRPRRAECQKALKERGANQRAATTGERRSLVILSLKGVRKAEPLISRRRRQAASWTGRDAGPLRGRRQLSCSSRPIARLLTRRFKPNRLPEQVREFVNLIWLTDIEPGRLRTKGSLRLFPAVCRCNNHS